MIRTKTNEIKDKVQYKLTATTTTKNENVSGWTRWTPSGEQPQCLWEFYNLLNNSICDRGILQILMLWENIPTLSERPVMAWRSIFWIPVNQREEGKSCVFISVLALHPFHSHFLIAIFIIFLYTVCATQLQRPKGDRSLFDKDRMSHAQWTGIFDRKALFNKASIATLSPTWLHESHRHLQVTFRVEEQPRETSLQRFLGRQSALNNKPGH